MRSILQTVTDCRNDERDGEGNGAVDTACGIEIIHADMIGKKIGVPCGKSGCKKLIDGVCDDDKGNKPNQKRAGVFDQHWKQRDADDVDGIEHKLACGKDPLSFFETFQDGGGKDVEQACDIRNKRKDTDFRFIQSVHQKKAYVEQPSRKLSHKSCRNGGKKHTEASSAKIVFYIIHVEERTGFYSFF